MRIHDLLTEMGVHDPHIFKAIFMAGQPGAGKSTVAARLFAGTGLRNVDIDQLEHLARKQGRPINDLNRDSEYERFSQITRRQLGMFTHGRLGLIIDGTAKNIDRIKATKTMIEELGYDCAMVFVNTNLQTAIDRAKRREEKTGRHVPLERIENTWREVQKNLGALQAEFHGRFLIIDNSGDRPDLDVADKWLRKFLNAPVNNIARSWLSSAR